MSATEFYKKTGSEIDKLIKTMSIAELEKLNEELNQLEGAETDRQNIKRIQRAAWRVFKEADDQKMGQ